MASLNRSRFLTSVGALFAASTFVERPAPARAQVGAVTIVGPALADLMDTALNSTIHNKIALANYLQALQIVENMVFDHESFLVAAWPSLNHYLGDLESRWNRTHFLDRSASDITTGLMAQFPGVYDPSGIAYSTFNDLEQYGLQSISQWISAASVVHDQATQAMANMNAVQAQSLQAQTAKDQIKGIVNAVAALGGINNAIANGVGMMIQSSQQAASTVLAQQSWRTKTGEQVANAILAHSYNTSQLPNPNITPHELVQQTRSANDNAMAVPLLRLPASP